MKTKNINIDSTKDYSICLLFALICLLGCKKLVDVDPPIDKITSKDIYDTDAGASSVLTGIYSNLSNGSFAKGINSIGIRAGLSADELTLFSGNSDILLARLYTNSLSNQDVGFWTELYSYIYKTNSAIEGISNSNNLNKTVKDQLLGEAKFLRSFFYFYLVNLYGDVPLLISTDYTVNAVSPRTSVDVVYNQIIDDLVDANNLLSENYLDGNVKAITNSRVRPNKAVAMALLSRVYLFTGNWDNAERLSTSLINDKENYELVTLSDVFLANSKETIWSLQPVNGLNIKTDAYFYILRTLPSPSQPVTLSNHLLDAYEEFDGRKDSWIGLFSSGSNVFYYPFKYKDGKADAIIRENITVFRLAEQYLIRAEAKMRKGNISGGIADLNIIRERVNHSHSLGSGNLTLLSTNLSLEKALIAVEHEREVELFSEWGHRWFDLKRSNRIDIVMSQAVISKGSSWSTYKALYPIPILDIKRNPSLPGHQNPGYPEQ
jgi:hypothetical protein